jgi:hypothetical protein
MKPLTAADALDRYFLEARSKLLDVAAILDRIHRGGSLPKDARLEKVRQALAVLQDDEAAKAERIQQVFSLVYDPKWPRPAKDGRNGRSA